MSSDRDARRHKRKFIHFLYQMPPFAGNIQQEIPFKLLILFHTFLQHYFYKLLKTRGDKEMRGWHCFFTI